MRNSLGLEDSGRDGQESVDGGTGPIHALG